MEVFLPVRQVKNDHDLMRLVRQKNLAVTPVKDVGIVDIGSVLMNVGTGTMIKNTKGNVQNILETVMIEVEPVVTGLVMMIESVISEENVIEKVVIQKNSTETFVIQENTITIVKGTAVMVALVIMSGKMFIKDTETIEIMGAIVNAVKIETVMLIDILVEAVMIVVKDLTIHVTRVIVEIIVLGTVDQVLDHRLKYLLTVSFV